jgi:hypothetical protein
MTPAQMRNEIDHLINVLFAAKLAIDSNTPVEVKSHGELIVSWSNEVFLSSLMDKSSTLDEYRETLRRRWYSAILFDGAMLQMSYTFSGNVLKKHRLCFYPCPIRFNSRELEDFTLDQLLEILDDRDLRERLRLEGPLRFDYDLDATTKDHPASHLTISRTSCRVPVSAPLSVGHFVKFLFAHFYPDQWATSEELRKWACTTGNSCLPDVEDDHLYIHWKRRAKR